MGLRGLLSIRSGTFVLALLALMVPAYADAPTSSKVSTAADTAEEGVSSAAAAVASQGTRISSDDTPSARFDTAVEGVSSAVAVVASQGTRMSPDDTPSARLASAEEGISSAAAAVVSQGTRMSPDDTRSARLASAEEGISSAAIAVASQGTRTWPDDKPSAQELQCLAEGMYYEARGEPWRGQLAVGRVILNRVKSTSYPDTVCGVVYQNRHKRNRCQFSFACDGKPDRIAERDVWNRVRGYANWLLANNRKGSDYQVLASLDAATHYHADYVTPHWAKFFELTARIGRHIFYSDPSA